jgi:MoaA/NifB/PqqE/SkfB family radical SAM enzyme
MPARRGTLHVDDQGRLVLPSEAAQQLGLTPGSSARYTLTDHQLRIQRSSNSLARVTIELTNSCNLTCTTCMRNVWDEPTGQMSAETWMRLMDGVRGLAPKPQLFLGGYGEPLLHPFSLDWLRQAKNENFRVELITNGILLDNHAATVMIENGLDTLWISIDGAVAESYADVRLGDALPQVIENIEQLVNLRQQAGAATPRLGIAFVAMRRNISDLPAVLELGLRLGAEYFSVTNVLAHTPELRHEALYTQRMYQGASPERPPFVNLPRVDITPDTLPALAAILAGDHNIALAGEPLNQKTNVCPFIEKGSLSIRWDGCVSPCLPLLHTHTSYLDDHERLSQAFLLGNINQRSLLEVWNDPAYVDLRQRLSDFDFSPCVYCNTCEYSEHNREDCFGNCAPTCGGCLWAQGIIQCP